MSSESRAIAAFTGLGVLLVAVAITRTPGVADRDPAWSPDGIGETKKVARRDGAAGRGPDYGPRLPKLSVP